MQDIQEQERRLSAALQRIGAAMERLVEPPPAAQVEETDSSAEIEIAGLKRKLAEVEAELAHARASLAEQETLAIASVMAAQDLTPELEKLTTQLLEQSDELQNLRIVNVQLRDALRSLREAMEKGAVPASEINQALRAELDALRAAHSIEGNELAMLLEALEPMVVEAERKAYAQEATDAEGDRNA